MFFSEIQNPVYVIWAFIFQLVLVAFFAVRRLRFEWAVRHGWIVYALSLVGLLVSIQQIVRGENWVFWIGGFIYFVWGGMGILVEYVLNISWRAPIVWKILIPYIGLYLATVMFYWWPLGEIGRGYWVAAAILFVISTILNLASHAGDKSVNDS